ncbi:glycosyltransferase family 4 protein [Chloroflexus sp.]|uniref:glycosyltransferase family 4 protein n=1 Tax=Chloroflexus sp. TaxID=1904827 RepID=UPI003D098C7D
MRVGIDMYPYHIFKTGIRTVIENLLQRWQKHFNQHEFVLLQPSRKIITQPRTKLEKVRNHLYHLYWSQIESQVQAKQRRCDLVFATCMFSPYHQLVPTVTLIHDMALWRHPEWYPRWWLLINRIFTEYPARNIRHIVAVSEYTRQDILTFFKLPESRVSTIYSGGDLPEVDPRNDRSILYQYNIPETAKYILHVGLSIPHKNLPRLVEAFGILVKYLPDQPLFLVLAGPKTNTHGQSDDYRIKEKSLQYNISNRLLFTGFIPKEHVTVLYRNAYIYAFPSLFEGFGLPLVEAMSSGVPVVASNRAALPEIGGDAGYYFDPLDVQDIVNALYTVATQPSLRQHMIQRGIERAKIFSWNKAAAQYVDLFEDIARGL